MNINTLSNTVVDYKSGAIPIALYPNSMRLKADGTISYYAKTVNRTKLSMRDIANDMVTTGVNNGYSTEQILTIWNIINNAILDRISNSCLVDCGIGTYGIKVKGAFKTETDTFNTDEHSLEISFHSSKTAKALISELKPVIRQGNSCIPQITNIKDLESNSDKTLTPGGFLKITGSNIHIVGDNKDVGLYFISEEDDSKNIKLAQNKMYINTTNSLGCVIPNELSAGNYKIKIVTQFSKNKTFRKETQTAEVSKTLTVK